jgi:hypothetical protein
VRGAGVGDGGERAGSHAVRARGGEPGVRAVVGRDQRAQYPSGSDEPGAGAGELPRSSLLPLPAPSGVESLLCESTSGGPECSTSRPCCNPCTLICPSIIHAGAGKPPAPTTHLHESVMQRRAMSRVARASGIPKRASCHILGTRSRPTCSKPGTTSEEGAGAAGSSGGLGHDDLHPYPEPGGRGCGAVGAAGDGTGCRNGGLNCSGRG